MKTIDHLSENEVNADEVLARIVLSPKDIDPITDYPKDKLCV